MVKKIVRIVIDWFKTHPEVWIAPAYLVVYLKAFFWMETWNPENATILHSPIDDLIPFCPAFVLIYASWFAILFLGPVFFVLVDKTDYLRYCFVSYTGMTLSLIIYLIWPSGLDLRQPLSDEPGLVMDLMRLLRSSDTSYNVCPSIHCASSSAFALITISSKRLSKVPWLKVVLLVWVVLIMLSTLFIKQHSIIDVFWGVVLSLTLFAVSWIPLLLKKKKEA